MHPQITPARSFVISTDTVEKGRPLVDKQNTARHRTA